MPKRKFCWDASVFTAWLAGEHRTEDEVAGLREIIRLVETNQALVITNVIARAEVIGPRGDPTVRAALDDIFTRPSFFSQDLNASISDLAGTIRTRARDEARLRLDAEDATYAATALVHKGVEALHSFDHDLLRLDGLACVEGLRICKPKGLQIELLF